MTGPLAVRERPERAVKPGTRGTPCSTSAAQWTSKMKNDAADKSFDVMKWLRATRAELYVETKIMSIDERREWESRRPTDPALARLFDRRKVPEGRRRGPARPHSQGPAE